MLAIKNCSIELFNASAGDKRLEIIAHGRAVMREFMAKRLNANAKLRGEPEVCPQMLSEAGYMRMNEDLRNNLFNYAGQLSYAQIGKAWTEDDLKNLKSMKMYTDSAFLKVLSDIVSEIVTPMLPAVVSDAMAQFMESKTIGVGQNDEITISSNGIFMYEETAWGVTSQRAQYLYDRTIVPRPKPVSARAKVKWYEFVANGKDMGELFNAIAHGLYAYIMGRFANALTRATADTSLIPSPYHAASYTDANFVKVTRNVSLANGNVPVGVFGDIEALSVVIPNATSHPGMQYGLGEEWAKMGYISQYKRVPLYEVSNALVPNTVNTTATKVMSTDVLYAIPLVGRKPIISVFEGGEIMVEISPAQTRDRTSEISSTVSLDVLPLLGNKMGYISNVA